MPPRILVTRRLPEATHAALRAQFDAELNLVDRKYPADELVARCAEKDGLLCTVGDDVSRATIERLPASIRVIATFSVGYDHVDVPAARARGIAVTNTPDVLTDATADTTMLLLLGASRRATEGQALVRSAMWTGWTPTQLMGWGLAGKRLGIVGMGRIGRAMARRARPFGLAIHYHDRAPVPDAGLDAVFHPQLESLLAAADVLSLHAPLAGDTRKLLDAARIALLPDGAIVVNSARGGLVDDEALLAALRSGKVAAAGLDVYDGEPHVHPGYLAQPNTFLLPHLGSATIETREAMGRKALENLVAFFAGRPPPDSVG
jgi:lactate dehydrogenase-like 2-hydroxyacid dehydrogenase